MARASEQEQKGSTGGSEVTGKFTRIGWGLAEVTRHDNGIDLFLMARDERLFDLGLTLGAQMKAGPSYFREPQKSNKGELEGWWFRDSDGQHLSDMHGTTRRPSVFRPGICQVAMNRASVLCCRR